MRSRAGLALVFLAVTASACGGPLRTGTKLQPADAAEEADAACPNDHSLCGTGPLAVCLDLQNDPLHCGSCEKTCPSGASCAQGVCQRVLCQGQPLLSQTPLTTGPTLDSSFASSVLADVNGDHLLDFVFWTAESKTPSRSFSVSLGQPGGGFAPPRNYPTQNGVLQVTVADVNHDGADDLLLREQMVSSGSGCMELWLGQPDGLSPDPTFSSNNCDFAFAFADFSGDGKFELLSSMDGLRMLVYSAPLVKDWNGDGFLDLVSVRQTLQLIYNRGDGTFDDAVDCGIPVASGLVVSDFNHDGHMDIATSGSYGVDVLFGAGGCRFGPVAGYAVTGGCFDLQTVDMDSDGQLDLLCMSRSDELIATPGSGIVTWNWALTGLLANPDGSFQAAAPIALGRSNGFHVMVGDVTGDQRPDLVLTDRNAPVRVWENTCR